MAFTINTPQYSLGWVDSSYTLTYTNNVLKGIVGTSSPTVEKWGVCNWNTASSTFSTVLKINSINFTSNGYVDVEFSAYDSKRILIRIKESGTNYVIYLLEASYAARQVATIAKSNALEFHYCTANRNVVYINGTAYTFNSVITDAGFATLRRTSVFLSYGTNTTGEERLDLGYIGISYTTEDFSSSTIRAAASAEALKTGWKRFDDNHEKISYTNMSYTAVASDFGGGKHGPTANPKGYSFKFKGTGFRLIGISQTSNSNSISLKIDGVESIISQKTTTSFDRAVFYAIDNLEDKEHHIVVSDNSAGGIYLDAVDINGTGYMIAQVGQVCALPDPYWKRIDDPDLNFYWKGSLWATLTAAGTYYGDSIHYIPDGNTVDAVKENKVFFKFKGTKLRLISLPRTTHTSQLGVKIDGVEYGPVNIQGATLNKVIVFEKMDLVDKIHSVELYSIDGVRFALDAIDIDENERMYHPILNEKFTIDDLTIGDCIAFDYFRTAGVISDPPTNFGKITLPFLNGTPISSSANSGYFIMVGRDTYGRKKLVCDRPMTIGTPNDFRLYAKDGYQLDEMTPSFTKTVSSEVAGYLSSEAILYSTYGKSIGWQTNTSSNEWFKAQYGCKRRISRMHYEAGSSLDYTGGMKNFRVESSDDNINWTIQYSGIAERKSGIQIFKWNPTESFVYWRVVLVDSHGAANFNTSIMRLIETEKNLTNKIATMTMLTGGIDTLDKENDFDKIIYEYDLEGKITAMDNQIWHYLGMYELTSSLASGTTANTVVRGTSSNYSTISATTTAGFRPVLLIEQDEVEMMFKNNGTGKYLYLDGENILESITPVSVLNSTDKVKIVEYIKANSLVVSIFQIADNMLLTYKQTNKILELKNYSIPNAITKINSIKITGSNLKCSIKKDNKNYIYENNVWIEETIPENWNTISEMNELNSANFAELITSNNFNLTFYFINELSTLDDVEVNVDISGYYGFADENDYDLSISEKNPTIEFKSNSFGTYKIAYVTGLESSVTVTNYINVAANENKEILFTDEVNYENLMITTLILHADEDNIEKVISDLNINDTNFNEIGTFIKENGKYKTQMEHEIQKTSSKIMEDSYEIEFDINLKELINIV